MMIFMFLISYHLDGAQCDVVNLDVHTVHMGKHGKSWSVCPNMQCPCVEQTIKTAIGCVVLLTDPTQKL